MAISIEHLTFSYEASAAKGPAALGKGGAAPEKSGETVLEDINLVIHDNEMTAIIGQNGAGKTTLLKNLTGLLRPTGGDIFIRGRNSRDMTVPDISAEAGFVMQNPDRQLFAGTVYDEAAYALRCARLPEDEIAARVEAALSAVGLAGRGNAYPPSLDRGDRSKTVIAAVLAMGSRILILDEPTGGQDYRGGLRIMDLVRNLHGQGYTIIFVTHTMPLVAEYARRVIVMHEKRVFMDGTAAEIFSREEELAAARILPPRITRLSRELRNEIPLQKNALTPEELGDMLLELKRRR